MVQVAAFLLVLAVVFAAKTTSVLLMHDDVIGKSVSFSWTKPQTSSPEDAWKREQAKVASPAPARVRVYGRRPKAIA